MIARIRPNGKTGSSVTISPSPLIATTAPRFDVRQIKHLRGICGNT